MKTRLWRVHAHVEYVVKGNLDGDRLVFYMYNFDERGMQNGSFERIWPPTRGIFFLCSEAGVLRAVQDLYESHLNFLRPGVPRIDRFSGDDPGRKIAALALSGEGSRETRAEFAEHVPYGVVTSLLAAGFRFTETLVAPLLLDRDVRVRDAACISVVDSMFWDDRCLDNVARDDVAPAEESRRKRSALLTRLASFRQRGLTPPLVDYIPGVNRENPEEVQYVLERLASNRDPVIASSASDQLRSLDKRQ